jgi:hypothetical protein
MTAPSTAWGRLTRHLFPGDADEHGAVLACGIAKRADGGLRLLVRDVFLAADGVDYVPGTRGYRQLTAAFVTEQALYCQREGLAYLAVHNHDSGDHASFSPQDFASHARGYPALLDIVGRPVGALVLSPSAVAGDLWLSGGVREDLNYVRVLGSSDREFTPSPADEAPMRVANYDRQARLFGDSGQRVLGGMKVGVVGAGGAGSLIVEYLARLGVGHLVVADPESVEVTNLPRLVGAKTRDAGLFQGRRWPSWLRALGTHRATPKVRVAERVARQASGPIRFAGLRGDIADPDVAAQFVDCDYLFLAADSMRARLLVNAIVQQYSIPGVQVGAKVMVDKATGTVQDAFAVVRPMPPAGGCLWCNGLIPPGRLAAESATAEEHRAQRYVDDASVAAPSVITLNALAAAHAVDDFLFRVLGLRAVGTSDDYLRLQPITRTVTWDEPRRDGKCPECGDAPVSRRGRGDGRSLPTRQR